MSVLVTHELNPKWSIGKVKSVIANQSRSVTQIPYISSQTGVAQQMFTVDRNTGKIIAMATTSAQESKLRRYPAVLNVVRVRHSYAELTEAYKKSLELIQHSNLAGLKSIGIDPDADAVVVKASKSFLLSPIGKEVSQIKNVVTAKSTEATSYAKYDIAAGWRMQFPTYSCSGGLITTSGDMLAAGHCTLPLGERASNSANVYLGYTTSSRLQNNGYDMGFINIQTSALEGYYAAYGLFGQNTAPIESTGLAYKGEDVCKFGETSGVTCGTVVATGFSDTFSDGGQTYLVNDQSEASFCVESGDSSGPVIDIDVNRALGVISNAHAQSCARNSAGNSSGSGNFQDLPAMQNYYHQTVALGGGNGA